MKKTILGATTLAFALWSCAGDAPLEAPQEVVSSDPTLDPIRPKVTSHTHNFDRGDVLPRLESVSPFAFGQCNEDTTFDGGRRCGAGIETDGVRGCVLRADGSVWCWGPWVNGPLLYPYPRKICEVQDAVAVTARGSHACALDARKQVWCWGENSAGQLGLGFTSHSGAPTRVRGLPRTTQISSGGNHTCAIDEEGGLWCWGENQYGQLGLGHTKDVWGPQRVERLNEVASLALDRASTCAVTRDKKVWCWGWNVLPAANLSGTPADPFQVLPTQVPGLPRIEQMDRSSSHACAVAEDSSVHCWGRNDFLQLGNEGAEPSHLPVRVPGLTHVAEVATGNGYTCIRTTANDVWCWGYNANGVLGRGFESAYEHAANVLAGPPTQRGVTGLSGGNPIACSQTSDAGLWCWGSNHLTRVVWGADDTIDEPILVELPCP